MKIISFAAAIFAVLVIVGFAGSQTPSDTAAMRETTLKIMFPKDKVYVTQETVMVIGLVSDDSIQRVDVRVVGGQLVGNGAIPVIKGAFQTFIKLRAGLNEISAFPVGSEESIAKVTLFFKTDSNIAELPTDFKEYFLHAATGQKSSCEDCHKLDTTPADYQRMNVMGTTCQTDSCHGDVGQDKFVHGPVGAGVCISCHNPHGSLEEHAVSRSPLPLCLICHENKDNELKQEHIHGIITGSGCIDCHDPHESPNRFQLIAGTTSQLCFTCHDESKSKLQHVHGPVAAGDCNACHDPHASPYKFLMPEDGDNLCFLCHEIIQEESNLPNAHKPVKEACSKCHDAHGSPNEKLLNKSENALCFDCHDSLKEHIQTATVQHKPVADGDCMKCHMPHGSDHTALLQESARQLCFACHTEIKKLISRSKYGHGPVQEDDCYACHVPHGSASPKILTKFFPAEFYNPYSKERYALCFECHNEDIALDEFTTALTNFRNGDQNLHYLHIHKVRKGRSCKACHEVHASNQARHIRMEVPYGKMWSYPIKFTVTNTGGTCIVGCHKPKDYDRAEPVVYE